MFTYNTWSILLQAVLCLVLLLGGIVLLKSDSKFKRFILLLTLGGFVLEGTDLCFRLLESNVTNHINYAVSQLLLLYCLTGVYAERFIRMPTYIKYILYGLACVLFIISAGWLELMQAYGFYPNIVVSGVICAFAVLYFAEIIKRGKVEPNAFVFNVLTFFFFAVEIIISTTYSFLITNHLDWVAPIWLFRMVLLIVFYVALIQIGWNTQKSK